MPDCPQFKSASPASFGLFWALIAAFGFSAKAIFVKLAYADTPTLNAVILLALRMLYALPIFVWIAIQAGRGATAMPWRERILIALLGLIGYYGASILDFAGLQYISAGLERLILFTYPTLTLLISTLFFGHVITRHEWIALGLCYAGITIAVTHDLTVLPTTNAVLTGVALVLASSLCYAIYLVGNARMIRHINVLRFTAQAMLASTAGTLVHFACTQPLAALQQSGTVQVLALCMAIFSTVIPVFAQSLAIRSIGAGRAALVGMAGPMITIALGWQILGEPISLWQLVGVALVIAGVWQAGRRKTVA